MPQKPVSVVIDTNLWVSFLLKRDFRKIDIYVKNNTLQLLSSDKLLAELTNVINRPKLKKYFSADIVDQLHLLFDK